VRLAAKDTGGDGAPVLLLHGQPGIAGDWDAVAARLAAGGMRAVVPDRPGYGRTGGRATGFEGNARAAVELLDRLGIERALLAGHSWGSAVALTLALDVPERVSGLVLVAPISPGASPGRLDRALANRVIGPPVVRAGFKLAGHALSRRPFKRLGRMLLSELPPEQVDVTAAQYRSDGVWRSFYLEQRAMVEELPPLGARLDSVAAPATIVYGTRDRVAPPANAHRLAELLPGASLVSAGPTGHLLPQQRPQLVADVIARRAA
jgi:pimeloyl-ACP methyl ester carboxylesterase